MTCLLSKVCFQRKISLYKKHTILKIRKWGFIFPFKTRNQTQMDLYICEYCDFWLVPDTPMTLWGEAQVRPNAPVAGQGPFSEAGGGRSPSPAAGQLPFSPCCCPSSAPAGAVQTVLAGRVGEGGGWGPLGGRHRWTSAAHVLFVSCLKQRCEGHGKSHTFSQSVPQPGRIDSWREPYILSAK